MYEFHYDCMIPKFAEKLQLCHVDKGRFNYHIEPRDLYDASIDVTSTMWLLPKYFIFQLGYFGILRRVYKIDHLTKGVQIWI